MSPILALDRALNSLQRYRVPLSFKDAFTYLESRLNSAHLLSLYQHYFPNQYAQSKATYFSYSLEVPSPKEQEFFHLVNDNLFPLGIDEWELEERPTLIPFYPKDIDWYNSEIDEFDEFIQFLICLYGETLLEDNWQAHFGINSSHICSIEQINWSLLHCLCKTASYPLIYLYDAISLIDHSTNIIWLDSTWEFYEAFDWSVENIDFLTNQWKQAKTLWENVEALGVWLEDSPDHKLATIDLWNQACR